MKKEAPRSRGTQPQVGREKMEEEKQKRGGGRGKPRERGWTGAAQQRPGAQHPGLTQDPVSCQACSQEDLKLPLPCGRAEGVAL